jgi:hypothetical protein
MTSPLAAHFGGSDDLGAQFDPGALTCLARYVALDGMKSRAGRFRGGFSAVTAMLGRGGLGAGTRPTVLWGGR